MPTPRAGWLGALAVIAGAALFGSLGVASRAAYDTGVEPFAFVAWRAASGALAIIVVVAVIHGPRAAWGNLSASSRSARTGLLVAVIVGSALNLAMFVAFERTTIALALLGFYTYPAMVAAAAAILGRERLDLARIAALGLALTGMIAVVLGGLRTTEPVRIDALGIGLGLLAACFQATFVLTSHRYAAIRADLSIGAVLVGSAIISGALTVATGGVAALVQPLGQPIVVALLICVGLFAAALPSVLFLTGIRWIGGVRAGILMLFEPVVGVLLAALFLAEGLHPLQVVGGATILAAALIVQRSTRAGSDVPVVAPAPGGP